MVMNNMLNKFDSYTFFAAQHWNHTWERQHELIVRFARLIHKPIHICKPLGLLNYNPFSIMFIRKIIEYKKNVKLGHSKSENPIEKNMFFVGGCFVPLHCKLVGKLNYFLLKRKLHFSGNNFFWGTYINYTIYEFFKRSTFKVYDIAERRSLNPLVPNYVKHLERKIVSEADVVFIDNHAAIEDYRNLNPNIYYIPQGVNVESMQVLGNPKREYIGYIGNFHFAINYPFLKALIKKNNKSPFLFVGSILDDRANEIMALDNVVHIDKVQKEELSNYLGKMKYGLIPYVINDVTVGVYPTKLFEYIAAGVPVVTTSLPEVIQYADADYMQVVDEPIELNKTFTMNKCAELLSENNWDTRWNEYIKQINKCLK